MNERYYPERLVAGLALLAFLIAGLHGDIHWATSTIGCLLFWFYGFGCASLVTTNYKNQQEEFSRQVKEVSNVIAQMNVAGQKADPGVILNAWKEGKA